MNLLDAIKSGRPFRRTGWGRDDWSAPDSWGKTFLRHDILADDWEIQEPTISITAKRFWEAADKVSVTVRDIDGAYKKVSLVEYLKWPITNNGPLTVLAQELGLEAK